MRLRLCAGFLASALFSTTAARATPGQLTTARTHWITVSGPPRGLEAEMPRSSAYGRGIRADAELDFAGSRRAYAHAVEEFRQLGREVWAQKASRQVDASMALERVPPAMRLLGSHMRLPPTPWLLALASAYHDKFLAVRAFLGRSVTPLASNAERLYRQILTLDDEHASARLGLAALYAELGRRVEADREFARVPEARRGEDDHLVEVARYFAASGRSEDALAVLERARRVAPADVREVALSNGFDRLRRDPRFVRLAGLGGRDRPGGPGAARQAP